MWVARPFTLAPFDGAAGEAAAFGRDVRCGCRVGVVGGRLGAGSVHIVIRENEAPDVAERLFPDGHLFEVVLPDGVRCGARGAAGKGFALDGYRLAFVIEAGVLLRREHETDLRALLPEIAGEVVCKEERVVAAAVFENGECVVQVLPLRLNVGLIPLAELEAVRAGAEDEHTEEGAASHKIGPISTYPERAWRASSRADS
jgi:hypothetical protein